MPYSQYTPSVGKSKDWPKILIKQMVEKYLRKNSKSLISENIPQIFVMSQDHISNRIMLNGIYERYYLDIALVALQANHLIFGSAVDAGANIGNHSLYLSKYYQQVYCFEPNPKIFKVLSANAQLAENINCYELGLSDNDSEETLHIINQYNLGESSILPQVDYHKTTSHQIRTIRLDTCNEVQSDTIGLIKIDVENFETQVLEGARFLIERDSPVIFFEQHAYDFPEKGKSSLAIETLRNLGYPHFYEIDLFPRFTNIKSRHLRNIAQHIARTVNGYSYKISKVEEFDQRFYSFIIATKKELTVR